MAGVTGIQVPGLAENAPAATGRVHRRMDSVAAPADGALISEEALAAAEAARFAVLSATGEDIRSELVAQARENLEKGVYRIQEVVIQVARNLFPAIG